MSKYVPLGLIKSSLHVRSIYPPLSLLPLIYIGLFDLDSFTMGWNQGRAGFIFASALLMIEYFDAKQALFYRNARKILSFTIPLASAQLLYFTSVIFLGLHGLLWRWGEFISIPLLYSWVWLWDYIVFTTYVVLLSIVFFRLKGVKHLTATVVYLLGTVLILSLDALFPYDTLGPLQSIVPVILSIDTFLIHSLSLGEAFTFGNLLVLKGEKGPFTLAVYWPSAGVHSIIIYSLVMLAFLIKLGIKGRIRLFYFIVGIIGTFFVNVARIFLLSAYALTITTDVAKFEEFHSIVGELLFLPWIASYLLLVGWVEYRRRQS